MASLSTATDGELTEFKRRLSAAGFTAEMLREVNRRYDMAKFMYDALMDHPAFTLVHGLFVKPEDQIKRVRELRNERGWNFPDSWLMEAQQTIPKWPEDRLVVVTLVPYLDDKREGQEIVMSGIERTFQELWAVAGKEQHANWRWDGYNQADSKRLRLLKGIEHKPGLRWEVIDLGCNRNKKPVDVRSAKSSPHAGIFATAALHPDWPRAMDGDSVPYVFAPGYGVNVSVERPWQDVPHLGFDRGDRKVNLRAYASGGYDPFWAVPSFRE